ncbi:MAG TPA: metallophosphoesterase [Clostridia bacterium]|nr:metallophosphoesterase [Clostridia bacterium]
MFIVLAIVLFISIYGFSNFYIGLRGWQLLGSFVPFLNNKVYWIFFWFVAVSYLIARLLNKYIPQFVGNAITLIGAYWMAVMIYAIILLGLLDITRLVSRFCGFKPQWMSYSSHFGNFIVGAALLLIIGTTMLFGTLHAVNVKINHYDIDIPKKAGQLKDLKVALISDTHLGNIVNKKRLEGIVEKINDLKPDLVLIAGDTVDDVIEPYVKQNMAETFRKLHPKYGVYAVLGNHEYYGGKISDIVSNFEKGSIQVLRDQYVKIADSFYIVGREDCSDKNRKGLDQIMNGLDKSLPVIEMDHQPVKLGEPEKNGVDLQLSGHTHGGQLFPQRIIDRFIFEKDWGYLRKGDFQLIVSSGAGTWGPPIRTGSNSEIVSINIKFK